MFLKAIFVAKVAALISLGKIPTTIVRHSLKQTLSHVRCPYPRVVASWVGQVAQGITDPGLKRPNRLREALCVQTLSFDLLRRRILGAARCRYAAPKTRESQKTGLPHSMSTSWYGIMLFGWLLML